jgi:Electron transfer DM13
LIAIVLFAGVGLLMVLAWRGRWDRRIRRHSRTAAVGLVLVLVITLPAAWYLGSPLFSSTSIDEPPPVAVLAASARPPATPGESASPSPATDVPNTAPPSIPTAQPARPIERSGSFIGADDFHFARGGARLVEVAPGEFTVRLEEFAVRNGPDLFVYLSPSGKGYTKQAIELGRLKADRGNQNYRVPAGTDVTSAMSVVIWCRQFGVLFGTATLTRE